MPTVRLEADEEADIVEWVEKELGGECVKLKIDGVRGFPDRTVLLPGGVVFFLEAKRRKGGVVSPHQVRWIEKLKNLGFVVEVVRSLKEAQWAYAKVLDQRG